MKASALGENKVNKDNPLNNNVRFEYTPTDKAPLPELGTNRIPVDRYTDPKYISLEDEKIWSKTWLLAGVESDLQETGSYLEVCLTVKN